MQRFRFTPRHPITRVAFTADGSGIVTAQPHTAVAVRDRTTGDPRLLFPAPNTAAFTHLLVHPTRPLIAVQSPKWSRVYDSSAGGSDHFDSPRHFPGIAVTPQGFRFFHTEFNETLFTVDAGVVSASGGTGTSRVRIRTTGEFVAVSPDGRFGLFVRQRTRPMLLDVTTGRVIADVASALRRRHLALGPVIDFSTDGQKVVLGDGESLAVFDLSRIKPDEPTATGEDEPGKKLKLLYPVYTTDKPDPIAGRGTHADRAAERWLPPVAFDPDGRTLLTVGLRNRVQRIDLASGNVMVEWAWRADAVRSLAVAPDGLTAAAGCRLGELIVWDLE